MPEIANPTHIQYPLSRERLMSALGKSPRWEILKVLADGDMWGASDLTPVTGVSVSATGKHLGVLVNAGICVRGRGKLYRLAPQFRPVAGSKVLDFGHCILRFDQPSAD